MSDQSTVYLPHAGRKFYDLEQTTSTRDPFTKKVTPSHSQNFGRKDKEQLLKYVEESVVGKDKTFSGPFGLRKVVYCDYIASGRSLEFIENYIRNEVLPEYGNTHTTTTVTSLQTTLFRHEARDIVRNAVNASEHDAVIFVGSGCTAAVHKLANALQLEKPPVVFVSPYEHHSNLLPWRELGATVVRIAETVNGLVDLQHLETVLKEWQTSRRQLIGCFAAASNITGILVDVDAVTILLHKYGALAFWDYATAGPYVNIDMNPVVTSNDHSLVYKDAVFISPHKFVGGVQTPGLLVAKKKLFINPVPSDCGGGSVFFVRRDAHRYLQEAEMREEGGTPAIVESIRAGLVFQLKEAVTTEVILAKERDFCQKAVKCWKNVKNLVLLGNQELDRLPVFSFLIKHPETGKFLHYNFICTLLNDLYGVQARGGCACAGPYAQDLLGIDEALASEYEELLVEDSRLDRTHLRRYREYSEKEILRPGFARLNLPYFMDENTVDFVLEAVKNVAQEGWKLLPQYNFNPETGEWRHKHHQVFKDRKWLGFINYKSGQMSYQDPKFSPKGPLPATPDEVLKLAQQEFTKAQQNRLQLADQRDFFDEKSESLRWFLLPSEASQWLQNPTHAATVKRRPLPFSPPSYPKDISNIPKSVFEPLKPFVYKPKNVLEDSTQTVQENGHNGETEQIVDTTKACFRNGMVDSLSEGFYDDGILKDDKPDQTNFVLQEDNSNTFVDDKTAERNIESNTLGLHDECETLKTVGTGIANIDSGNSSSTTQSCAIKRKEQDETQKGGENKMPNNSESNLPKKECKKWHCPPKNIFAPTIEALQEFEMLKDGDKVLVCLSGGKDSLSLLHTIRQYQFYAKKKGVQFEFGAVTVDPQTSSYDPSPLKAYLAELGVPYFYEEQCILETATNLPDGCASICSFCSRMKRGRIYACARREGYNVLALGQHLDDLSESFLMSMFHNGLLRTMKASYTNQEGDLRIIRPFVYVREKDLRQFAEQKKLPVIAENCPACFEAPKERHRMKQLLAAQEILFPRLFHSILAAMKPILSINKTGVNIRKLMGRMQDEDDSEEKDIEET